MSLPIEYFIDQTHITDLQKLQDEKLYHIIRLFRDELEKFNESEEFKLKGLIIACNEMKDLIKDFRFILNGYIKVINNQLPVYGRPVEEEDLDQIPFCLKEEIEELLKEMDKIENNLDKIKAVRLLKEKVDELGNKCLYKMRILYDSLNDFIYGESCFWDKIDLEKKEIIIKQWHYDAKAKADITTIIVEALKTGKAERERLERLYGITS